MKRLLLTLGLLAAPAALAQSAAQEARFTEALKAMDARSLAFYVSVDPRFEPLLTPTGEDPAYADSQRCVLRKIGEEGGADMLEAYIAGMEFMGGSEIVSLLELGARMPPIMASDLVLAAATECGAMTHMTQQMATAEFQALMEEPEVMKGLMGQ